MSTPHPYVVRGCADTHVVAPRHEIRTLMGNDEDLQRQFSLFIQAMSMLQKSNYVPEPARLQEIGGIHGVPYSKWSGDPSGPDAPVDANSWGGYCFHSCSLFPTWHRVVMLTIEQAISEAAHKILEANRGRLQHAEYQKWKISADKLRFPFWDWSTRAEENSGLPKVFSDSSVDILGWDGKKYTLSPNPLESFTFNQIPADAPDNIANTHFTTWKRTYRWADPASKDPNHPVEQYDKLNLALTGAPPTPEIQTLNVSGLRSKLNSMFSYPLHADDPKNKPLYWNNFSNVGDGTGPVRFTYASLEDPHNKMHLDIGGYGDMAYVEIAGFDPIFYFHHCNIDRLYSLWEYIYPDYWLGEGWINSKGELVPFTDATGSYQLAADKPIDQNSDLAPFRKGDGKKYWNSVDTRGLQQGQGAKKYYTYDPLHIRYPNKTITIDISKPYKSEAERATYNAALQDLYSDSSTVVDRTAPRAKPPFFHQVPKSIPDNYEAAPGIHEFIVVGRLVQYMVKTSYHLELFLDGILVNEMSAFNRLVPERCENCTARENQEGGAKIRVPMRLPHAVVCEVLDKYGYNEETTSQEDIIKCLKEHLTARITSPDRSLLIGCDDYHSKLPEHGPPSSGEYIPDEKKPVLELYSNPIFHPKAGHLPILRGEILEHGQLTTGRWRLAN
ncbi:common central domain of tyrosinase-domain-containing protein [Abortiporus biennis]|nr:common central domain of tyrosinase-domain-containing protein [Abortiporus biennis]